jgi:SAM-dependent methyltransferase
MRPIILRLARGWALPTWVKIKACMKRTLRRLTSLTSLFGFDPRHTAGAVRGMPHFWRDYRKLKDQYQASNKEFPFGKFYPCLEDRFAQSGAAGGHYFHQDLLVAQWLFHDKPQTHVDVGSRIDGFVAHVAAFREIEVFDIRPLDANIRNIRFRQADFTAEDFPWSEHCDSASCLHALEHFGLGRYGDPLDYYGYRSGWNNLRRLLKPGGRLYFSVPIGPQRIEFNGHRVFAVPYLVSMIEEIYTIERFAYVNQADRLILDADPRSPDAARSFDCQFGCGIFSLIKR